MKKEEYSLTNRSLGFKSGNGTLTVSVNTNLSAFQFVRDILTVHTTQFKDGKRIMTERPKYVPENTDIPTETNKALLKRLKAAVKKQVGANYRPTTILTFV